MYKFAIGYYTMEGTARKPQSGLDIRLLRPGQSWSEGKHLIETVPDSGYYEIGIQNETDCGFYEIWDNLGNSLGQFSGKTCTIGKMDARGIQNNSIYANHILDGAVTGSKIANAVIGTEHLQNGLFSLTKLQYEMQDQDKGVGDNSQASPAKLTEDKIITHTLIRSIRIFRISSLPPSRCLPVHCRCHIEGNLVISNRISQVYTATDPFYKLLALAK